MILVTGATGTVGRHLIERLLTGRSGVRAVSRDPAAAGLPDPVEVVGADLARTDVPAGLLHGVHAVFVNPAAVGENADKLVAAARYAGVGRLVVLAASNVEAPEGQQPSRFLGHRNREVEAAVVASGVEWVSLRPATFHTNALHWADQLRAGDVVRGPFAAVRETPVDPRDIAAVAALALSEDGAHLAGRRLELTGPQALSQHRLVADLGAVTNRRLRYQEIPATAVRQGMARIGAPDGFADAYVARLAHLLDHPPGTTDTIQRLLGRPAITFAQWAREHAAAFQIRDAAPNDNRGAGPVTEGTRHHAR
ncbi:NAD(P)H-binding protein [Amycolatopsis sp. CA-230715]|uniref:NAD(P)H-binding protein n=1 Tax=Amycolatopsis sp. CA-230715 TaxID=2745196 RepID=UPI001C02EB01|nr:NAD(P)H-binding protein [Amycolatopsis sp. CA-230715]QWF82557.1 NAD(P)H azoreductase [Amycolatopsis sp. CA-230715]